MTMPVSRWHFLFGAWLVALVASLGALFVGEVMGQVPCHLCWFQRAFMFPLAVTLGIAALRNDPGVARYALPLAVIGGLLAGYHALLYAGIIPQPIIPCTASGPSCTDANMTVLGMPLPFLSTLAFALVATLTAQADRRSPA